jgi:3-deoxy-D-manno-octulosonic-acid transferase
MVFWLYNLLIVVASPLWGVWLLWRLFGLRKDRRGFRQRWCGLDASSVQVARGCSLNQIASSMRVWIHAVSVGEAMAMAPLVKALRLRYPEALLVGSTVTDLGQEAMRTKLPELDLVFYAPFDVWWSVRRTIRAINPTLFLFGETELWPNLLLQLERCGVTSVLVNGRVSDRSTRRYQWTGWLMRTVVRTIDAVIVQAAVHRTRFIELGADPARLTIAGNLKADHTPGGSGYTGVFRRLIGVGAEQLIVAGSTHEPEERLIAQAFLSLLPVKPGLRLCLAPRHLDRLESIEMMLRRLGLSPVRRSRIAPEGRAWPDGREVLLLDTIGELAECYTIATVTIMGGTFAPIGGHNLLEPAAAGSPILIGPHVGQWSAVAEELVAAGAACMSATEEELTAQLQAVLGDAHRRHTMSDAAREYVVRQQGATARTMAVIMPLIESGASGGRLIHRRIGGLAACGRWLFAPGRLASLARMVLAPVAWGYGWVTAIRRWSYRRGWFRAAHLQVPVISVGNLTVGGSGKTPAVIAIGQLLQSTGLSVGIVLRGYRGIRREDPLLVSDGHATLAVVEQAGDEAVLLAKRLPGISVAVGKSRAAAGRLLLANCHPDCVLIDDGYQHLSLARDVNVLIMDEMQSTVGGRLLPCGPLRESWSAIRDASAVIITHRCHNEHADVQGSERRARLVDALRHVDFGGPVFSGAIQPIDLIDVHTGRSLGLGTFSGRRVAVSSGIGQPQAFRDLVMSLGAMRCIDWEFDDHHRYERHELEEMAREAVRRGAAAMVTTEKDAVKFDQWPTAMLPAAAIRIQLRVEPDELWRTWLMQQLMGRDIRHESTTESAPDSLQIDQVPGAVAGSCGRRSA